MIENALKKRGVPPNPIDSFIEMQAFSMEFLVFVSFHTGQHLDQIRLPQLVKSSQKSVTFHREIPLYQVYKGLIIKATIPRVPPISLWILQAIGPTWKLRSYALDSDYPFRALALSGFANKIEEFGR